MMDSLRSDAVSDDPLQRLMTRHSLAPALAERLRTFLAELQRHFPDCRVRLNRNRRVMLSLRVHAQQWTVSLHQTLLEDDSMLAMIPGWMKGRGRHTPTQLRQGLQKAWERQHQAALPSLSPCPALEALGGRLDLLGIYHHVHATWFARYPRPEIRWSRASARRPLTHMRFACYKRSPSALILINPRLDQPWVARVFVEHVLYHELCHHVQAMAPVRGETAHGKRFRALERAYPHHAEAMQWEQRHLRQLLDVPVPP